jgi:spore maturation protein CgeB
VARILLVHPGPDFSVADVMRGWRKALVKLGHDVRVYNTNERLMFYGQALFEDDKTVPCEHCGRVGIRKALPDPAMIAQMATAGLTEDIFLFQPDVIFYVSAFFQPGQNLYTLRRRGYKLVMLHTESPYQDSEQMLRGQFASLNLLNDPTNLDAWTSLAPTAYVPHSYDPDVHFPAAERNYGLDFAFIGTAFYSRCEFFSQMNFDGIDLVFGGNGWDSINPKFHGLYRYLGHKPEECVDNTEAARIYRMAKAGINFYRREGEDEHKGEGWSMGPREIEMAACGLFFLRDSRPESDETFPMLPSFSSPAEAEEMLRYYIAHDSKRETLADQAHEAIEDWTFDNRAKDVCAIMEKLGIL